MKELNIHLDNKKLISLICDDEKKKIFILEFLKKSNSFNKNIDAREFALLLSNQIFQKYLRYKTIKFEMSVLEPKMLAIKNQTIQKENKTRNKRKIDDNDNNETLGNKKKKVINEDNSSNLDLVSHSIELSLISISESVRKNNNEKTNNYY